MSETSRVGNADLQHKCKFCGDAFPRMYRIEDGVIVCKLGGVCRNGKEQKVAATQKLGAPLQDVSKSLKVRIGKQDVGRIDLVPLKGKQDGQTDYRAYIAHPEGWVNVGIATHQQGALDLIGNAIMHKLWEV